MEKKCSKCASVFNCQNEAAGCWCEQLTLSEDMLHFLKHQYENCLCPACLYAFSENKRNPVVNKNNN